MLDHIETQDAAKRLGAEIRKCLVEVDIHEPVELSRRGTALDVASYDMASFRLERRANRADP